MNTITIGVDLAKSVFSVCEMDSSGHVLRRRDLKRDAFAAWLAQVVAGTVVAMEAHCSPDTIAMMEEDLDILRSDWKAFIGRWLPVIMPKDWKLFGIQAESMMNRLSEQVKLETELLYDHALEDGVVRRGAMVLH